MHPTSALIQRLETFQLTSLSQLKPGGYIELHEIHVPIRYIANQDDATEPYFARWSHGMVEGGNKAGLDFSAPDKLKRLLQEAEYVDVNVQWHKWPVGPWAKGEKYKEIGRAWAEDLKIVTRGTIALFTRVLGWSSEDFERFADDMRDEIEGGKRYMWVDM